MHGVSRPECQVCRQVAAQSCALGMSMVMLAGMARSWDEEEVLLVLLIKGAFMALPPSGMSGAADSQRMSHCKFAHNLSVVASGQQTMPAVRNSHQPCTLQEDRGSS